MRREFLASRITVDALTESQIRYRALFESANDAIFLILGDVIVDCNPKALEIFGRSRSEFEGKRPAIFSPLTQPDGRPSKEKSLEMIAAAMAGRPQSFEWVHTRGDGSLFVAEVSLNRIEVQGTIGLQSIVRDITKRKQAEDALKASEQRFSVFMSHLPAAVFIKDQADHVLFANEYIRELFGWQDPLGRTTFDLLPTEIAEQMRIDDCKVLEEGLQKVAIETIRDAKDIERTFETYKFPVPVGENTALLGGIAIDITERQRIAVALQESEQRFRAIYDSVNDAILLLNKETGAILDVNQRMCEIYGYTRQEALKLTIGDISSGEPPYTQQKALDLTKKAASGEPRLVEWHCASKSGNLFWVEINMRRAWVGGQPRVLVTARDITERKHIGHALEQSESRYRLLFEHIPLPTFLYDVKSLRFLMVNEAATRQYGYSRDEFLAMTLADIHREEDMPALIECLHSSPLGKKEAQWQHRKKDGSTILVESHSQAFPYTTHSTRLIVVHDITEKKRTEEELRKRDGQLQQSQKMEAMGLLASGVAHDFNNILTGILGYSDLGMMHVDSKNPVHQAFDSIRGLTERAGNLTRQLLTFSRKQVVQPQLINLNTLVTDLKKMLGRILGENITVETLLAPELPPILADTSQMEQVIMNLAVNARDAMPNGGTIRIETSEVALDEAFAAGHLEVSPGPHVVLAITDTGQGIDDTILPKIFEPFFTTKEAGKGTGLGLSTVYGIVKQTKGSIQVHSVINKGTTFTIHFPVAATQTQDTTDERRVLQMYCGSETVLLVEDDDGVRQLAKSILDLLGYCVIPVRNGDEALAMLSHDDRHFDLLLTDTVMPGMNGLELARLAVDQHKDLRVLYTSGYTENNQLLEIRDRQYPFIQKPFTPLLLAQKLRDVLKLPDQAANRL